MSQLSSGGADQPGTAARAAGGRWVRIAGALALALLGAAGNYFAAPLFFGVDLVFGSIATFVAIRLFGGIAGVLVAIPGVLYTIVLWGQPYAAIVLMCEVVFIALLGARFRYLALADALFWLVLGGPLLSELLRIFAELPGATIQVIVLKQFVNEILNISVASIIVMGLNVFRKRRDLLFSELLFNILLLVVLVPGVALVVIDTRLSRVDLESAIADKLKAAASLAEFGIRNARERLPPTVAPAAGAMALQAAIERLPLEQGMSIRYLTSDARTRAETGSGDLASSGTTLRVSPELQVWLPERAGASTAGWWMRAKYMSRRDLNDLIPGSSLLTTYDAKPVLERLQSRNLSALVTLGALTILTILLALFLTRFLYRPLQRLILASARLAEDVGKKNVIHIPRSPIRETNVLADRLEDMANALSKSLAEERAVQDRLRESQNVIKELLAADLRVASEIQMGMIPHDFSALEETYGVELAGVLEPAREVGGDLYSVFPGVAGRLVLLIGDVSGKGIPASLFMVRASTLAHLLGRDIAEPERILARLNDELSAENPSGMFVTMLCAIFDPVSGRIAIANAGHNRPVLLRDGAPARWAVDKLGTALGFEPNLSFERTDLALQPGDSLVIYTDGVNEAFNAQSECYGNERLLHGLTALASEAASAVTAGLLQQVRAFVAGAPQSDDIAILACRLVGPPGGDKPPGRGLALELQATPREVMRGVEQLQAFGRAHQVEEKALFGLALALEECSANIVHYACGDRPHEKFRLSFERSATALAIELRDHGPEFDPTRAPAPDPAEALDDRPPGGWGIFLVRQYTDEIHYAREGGENVLRLIKRLQSSRT